MCTAQYKYPNYYIIKLMLYGYTMFNRYSVFLQDMENKIRNVMNEIYFGKTKDIVNGLRSVGSLADLKKQDAIMKDLVQAMNKRSHADQVGARHLTLLIMLQVLDYDATMGTITNKGNKDTTL